MLVFHDRNQAGIFQPVDQPDKTGEKLVISQDFSRADALYLVEEVGLAGHVLNDLFDKNELPRVEVVDDFRYVFLRNTEPSDSTFNSHPILFVVGKEFLACLSAHKSSTANILQIPDTAKVISLQKLLINGIFAISKNYEKAIDVIGNKVASIERKMRSHEANNQDFYSFVTIESNLSKAKMSLTGLSTVVEKLLPSAKNKSEQELLDDIMLFAKQLLVEIDSHAQTIKSIREAYSTVANNTLNQRMKMLTGVTLLLALPNVFYGMYGMNIALPFMHEPWAYGAIVGFTLVLIFVVYLVAKKKRIF